MLVNIIQNTISSFRSALAAAEVITTNLKMWLGFETSETLGREEVTNGDFATDSDWNKNSNWSISGGVAIADGTTNGDINQGTTLATIGNSYSITYEVVSISQGSFYFKFGGVSGAFRDEIGIYTEVIQAINTNRIALDSLNNAIGSVTNISVKELTQITPDKSGNNNVGELFTGKALELDGANDYVNTTGFEMSGTSATFAFWIYPKDTTYQFVMDLDGTVRSILGLFNGGSGQVFAFFNFGFKQFGTPTQNQWQRVVFRVNATTVECYVDGVKSGSTLALASSIDLSTVGNSVIGGRYDTSNTGNRFDGSLSDFQIYNAYWSTDDIAYDYANPQNLVTDRSGTSIALSNLKGYWALSEGKGSTAYDSSGEGNNGTIIGATYEIAQPRIPQLGMMNWSKGSNLLTYSEDFSQSVWTKNNLTETYGFTSPTGLLNATRLRRTSTNSYIDSTINITTVQYNTASIYVKGVSSTIGEDVRLYVYNGTSVSSEAFTLTGDWQRITHTNSATPGQSSMIIKLGIPNVTNGEVLIWGAQLEQSSSPSAYRLTDGAATLNSTVIPNPTIPTQDIFGNALRDRLNSFNLGKFGGARVDAFTLSGNQATIQLWFKNVNSNDSLYLADLHSATDRIILGFNSSQLSVYHEITGAWQNFGTITDGDWNFATFTFDGTSLKCFVGTSQLGVTKTITAINLGTTEQFGVGMNHYFPTRTQDYNGHISDFLIYDRVLTSDEIENNYNAGSSAHRN